VRARLFSTSGDKGAFGREEISKAVSGAVAWMTESGIQNWSDGPSRGGCHAWYAEADDEYAYLYAEITGYLLTFYAWAQARSLLDKHVAKEHARAAADWLISQVRTLEGSFRCLVPTTASNADFKKNLVYSFDNGIILNGLVHLFELTGDERYGKAAKDVANWLVSRAQKPDGSFRAVYDVEKKKFCEPNGEWSYFSGAYHTKIAIGLLSAHRALKDDTYLKAAQRCCEFALTTQKPDGRFVTYGTQDGTNCHPHCYSAEGLWVVGMVLEREDFVTASARAVGWLLTQQNEEGFIPRLYQNGKLNFNERMDIQAQTLRMATIHRSSGRISSTYDPKIQKLLNLILKQQSGSIDLRSRGGFYFGRFSDGEKKAHVNSWVTMFSAQALEVFANRASSPLSYDPLHLI
jgi:rhamnogalacturonyl hydrolase YesR